MFGLWIIDVCNADVCIWGTQGYGYQEDVQARAREKVAEIGGGAWATLYGPNGYSERITG